MYSRASNWRARWSPENSSWISAAAIAFRSLASIFSVIRSNDSKALLSDIPDIVSWMRCCASARLARATRMFFFRLASSILSLSWRSESLSASDSALCLSQVSWSCWAPWRCSLYRPRACLARSSRPSCTASIALRSQSSACFFSASASDWSFFSSAMAEATCCLALASCVFMSTISWLSIFSGFSAREMRSLMFDRSSAEKRSMIPMEGHLSR